MKFIKTFARGFREFMDHGPSLRRVCLGLWFLAVTVFDPLRAFGHFDHLHDMELMLIAYSLLIPILTYTSVDLLVMGHRFRAESKEFKATMHKLQIKGIVLDTLLELKMKEMTPDQQIELMLKMPVGPKE